jgi:hypothetical protein
MGNRRFSREKRPSGAPRMHTVTRANKNSQLLRRLGYQDLDVKTSRARMRASGEVPQGTSPLLL